MYVILRNTYGPQEFLYGDVARKTERLVRDSATIAGTYQVARTAEFDAATLEALQKRPGSDAGKVVNLVGALLRSAELDGEREPHLLSIAERATAVLEALEERRVSTEDALTRIEALVAEKAEAERLRRETGLDADIFGVFWLLRKDFPAHALGLAREIGSVGARFPNAGSNADEFRQLKAETYKVLMRVVTGRPMIELAERVLGLRRDQ